MGQAKHAPTTPPNHPHPCTGADGAAGTRRAALAAILALSTAAGAAAIVVGAEALPKPAAAKPEDPDAAVIAFCRRLLPAIERLEAMSAEMRRQGRLEMTDIHERLLDETTAEAHVLAAMHPVTLPGFVAKARIARYHLFLGIAIARDLDALGVGWA